MLIYCDCSTCCMSGQNERIKQNTIKKLLEKKKLPLFVKNVENQKHHTFSFELWCLIFVKSDLQCEEDFGFHFLPFTWEMEMIIHLYSHFLLY